MACRFIKAWIGKCVGMARKSGYCKEHEGLKCVSCGQQATHECNETGGLVCGSPLCDDCTHNVHPEGHNGMFFTWPEGMKMHCRKSEQKYAPWYVPAERLSEWKSANDIPAESKVILTCWN